MKFEDGFIFEFRGVRDELDNILEIIVSISRLGKCPWFQGMKVSDLLKKDEGFSSVLSQKSLL